MQVKTSRSLRLENLTPQGLIVNLILALNNEYSLDLDILLNAKKNIYSKLQILQIRDYIWAFRHRKILYRHKTVLMHRGWGKKKFPSIFAYSANTIGLRSLWHLDELFLTKFPLKWCIVCICSLSGSRNIYKNVFSIKLQFLRICNFFHEKTFQMSFFAMAAKKRCDSIAFFYELNHHKKLQ